MKRAASASPTLTAARLDRRADLDRDYTAVATALHYDIGVPAGDSHTADFCGFRLAARYLTGFQAWGSAQVRPHGRVRRVFLRGL